MGGIGFKTTSISINQNDDVIPKRLNAYSFTDSILQQTGDVHNPNLETNIDGSGKGLRVAQSSGNLRVQIGDFDNLANHCSLTIDDGTQVLAITGAGLVATGGVHSPTTKFLKVTVEGVAYTIQLLT
jgi:hypothetical protein